MGAVRKPEGLVQRLEQGLNLGLRQAVSLSRRGVTRRGRQDPVERGIETRAVLGPFGVAQVSGGLLEELDPVDVVARREDGGDCA